jgi:hypothetical protein
MPPQQIQRLPDLLGDGLQLCTHDNPLVGTSMSVGAEEVFRAGPFVNTRGQ